MIQLNLQNAQTDITDLSKYFPLLDQIPKHESTGWLDLPEESGELLKSISAFAKKNKKKFHHIVVCGIGGSSLGILALQKALAPFGKGLKHPPSLKSAAGSAFAPPAKGELASEARLRGSKERGTGGEVGKPRLFVLDNLDTTTIHHILTEVDPKTTLFLFISKSGETLETITQFLLFKKFLAHSYTENTIIITDPEKGYLREIVKKDHLTSFEIPPDVGGRFSVLTAVGLLPTTLLEKDPSQLLKGAGEMKKRCLKKSNRNPALQLAALTYKLNKPIMAMMAYSDQLYPFTLWYQQLLAESIGKTPKIGLTPLPLRGSSDQHSVLQLLQEGPKDKLVVFLDVATPQVDLHINNMDPKSPFAYLKKTSIHNMLRASLGGTAKALAEDGRPSVTITIPKIDEHSLGELIFLFEMQVALLGEMYGINAFNQPGVEKSKLITKKLLLHPKP